MKHKKDYYISMILMLTFLFSIIIQMEIPAWADPPDWAGDNNGIPFQKEFHVNYGTGVGPVQGGIDIPAGYRFVMNNFTAGISLDDGIQPTSFIITTTMDGHHARHHFLFHLMADGASADTYVAGEERLLFADANEVSDDHDLSFSINLSGNASVITNFSVTGYLVPLD